MRLDARDWKKEISQQTILFLKNTFVFRAQK